MDMMKRLTAGVLCLLLLLGLLPAPTFAVGQTTSGDWTYTVSDENTVTINKYNGSARRVSISSADFNGLPVTAIGASAFSGCKNLVTVEIPATVTTIGSGAFSSCSALTSVRIDSLEAWCAIHFDGSSANPLSSGNVALKLLDGEDYFDVEELSYPGCDGVSSYAFYNYKKLTSVRLSRGSVGDYAFYGCTELTKAELAWDAERIGDYAFYNCAKLEKMAIPDGVTEVGKFAFSNCRALASLTVPESTASFGSSAFSSCQIQDVYLDDLSAWCEIDFPDAAGNPLNNAQRLYVKNTPVTDLAIPEGVDTVNDYAFYGFKGLKCVILPSTTEYVLSGAFQNCSNLECVLFPAGTESIAANAFNSCAKLSDVYYTGSEKGWKSVTNYDTLSGKNMHYNAGKYIVSIRPGAASGSNTETAAIGDRPYTLPECSFYTPSGKEFLAWEINGAEYAVGTTFLPAEQADSSGLIAVTALWSGINRTISFDSGEGGTGRMEPQIVADGSTTYTLPKCEFTPPTGMTFDAWSINNTRYDAESNYAPTGNVTAVALWKPITIRIEFAPGDGSGTMEPGSAEYGKAFVLPEATFTPPDGMHFKAWSIGTSGYGAGEKITLLEDTTATAVWGKRVTISFDPGEGGTGSMSPVYAAAGNYAKLPVCGFTAPEGCGFWRWDIGGTLYSPYDKITANGDLTATAVWAPQVTVRFDAGIGSGSMSDIRVFKGKDYILPVCEFTPPENRAFNKWKIGNILYDPGMRVEINEDVTIQATWNFYVTVSFDANGGSGSMSDSLVLYGEEFTLPECGFTKPADLGVFKAWSINDVEYAPGDKVTISSGTTVTALWKGACSVTFDAGDETQKEEISVGEGDSITLPECTFTPPKGQGFKAWRVDGVDYAPGSDILIQQDTTVTAVWDEQFSVRFSAGWGSGAMNPLLVTKDESVTLPACAFTAPAGNVFEAWRINGRKYTVGANITPTKDITVEAVWNDQFECTVSSGEATVTKYKGSAAELTIPNILGGFPVTGIGPSAFSGCTSLTRLTIPEGVNTVGASAFYGCDKMVRIDVPSSLRSVGSSAFYRCSELTGVFITDLAAWCQIRFVDSDSNPLSIAKNLYLNETLVTEMTVPNGTTGIGAYAFYGCTSLTNVRTIPNSVTSIGSYAFYGCRNLANMERIPDSVTSIGSYAFSGCTSLSSIVLPNQLERIEGSTFSGCSSLKSVTVPESVTSIGGSAFSGCSVNEVRIDNLAKWCRIEFENTGSNPLNGAQSLYVRGAAVTDLTIQNEITSVNSYAFYGFRGLKCVIIPQDAAIIYTNAFSGCSNLEYILIPAGMQSLGANAFNSCGKMHDVYFTGSEDQWLRLPNYKQFVSSSITVHYNAKQITVTLDPGEGSGTSEVTSAISGRDYVLTQPSFTAPEGKRFNAWQVGEEQYLRGQSFIPTEDITITAIWGDITYLVEYASNGGQGTMEKQAVRKGEHLLLPECGFTAPTGKQFKAWEINGAEHQPNEQYEPEADVTVTALWEPLTCIISFEADGGSGTTEAVTTTYQTEIELPACTFTAPEGKIFKAWKLNGSERQPGYKFKPTQSATASAVWQDIKCTMSFDANGGSGSMSSYSGIVYGTERALPRCSFTAPTGKAFLNWEIEGETFAVGDKVVVKKDLTVRAVWVDQCVVTFAPGTDGTGTMNAQTLKTGDVFKLPSCSFRAPSGKEFKSWQIGSESYAVGDTITLSQNITVTAIWGATRYDIRFVRDSESGITETMDGYHGIAFTLPECSFTPPIDLVFKAWSYGGKEYAPGDTVTPTGAMTLTAVWTGTYLYTVNSGETTITGYTGEDTQPTIPQILGGYPVTAIGAKAFINKTALTDVSIPNGVTSIGMEAFSGCAALRNVTLPDGLLRIENRAFYGCVKLYNPELPDSVTSIGSYAFYGCKDFAQITVPSHLKSVGSEAFSGCTGLSGVYITDLEGWCGIEFESANSNPLTIAKNLYWNGNLVEQLVFPEKANLTAIGNYAFNNCIMMTGVSLPKSLESIGAYSFSGCTGLKHVEIPNSVTSLGNNAFSGCSKMTRVTLPTDISEIPNSAFGNCSALVRVDIPNGVTQIRDSAFSGCGGLTILTVPASVEAINTNAFYSCTSLRDVHVTDLAAWCDITFQNQTANPLYYAQNLYVRGISVKDLTIQDNIAVIRSYAFDHFKGLRSVIIPQKATSVQKNSFTNCANLEYILIPEGMGSLGDNAFDYCSKLHDVYFTGTEAQWKNLPNFGQFVKNGITVHYQSEKITVTFAAANGTDTKEETSAISGRAYVLTGCDFQPPEGKVFKAWKIGDREYLAGESVVPATNITAAAVWVDAIEASVEDQVLRYQINASLPADAKLVAVAYNSAGQQIGVQVRDISASTGELKVADAANYRIFLLQGKSFAPVCNSWDSGVKKDP